MTFHFQNLPQVPVGVPPHINEHLVHVARIGCGGEFEDSSHVGFTATYEREILIPAAQEKGQIILSFDKPCRRRDLCRFVRIWLHDEFIVIAVGPGGFDQFRLRLVAGSDAELPGPNDLPEREVFHNLANGPAVGRLAECPLLGRKIFCFFYHCIACAGQLLDGGLFVSRSPEFFLAEALCGCAEANQCKKCTDFHSFCFVNIRPQVYFFLHGFAIIIILREKLGHLSWFELFNGVFLVARSCKSPDLDTLYTGLRPGDTAVSPWLYWPAGGLRIVGHEGSPSRQRAREEWERYRLK